MSRALTPRQLEFLLAAVLSLISFFVYVSTLCPTVNYIDSGELAAVIHTLGIPHPSGYPLFTLLGWIFTHLPLGMRVIYQANLMAAVFCSASIFFFFRLFLFVLGRLTIVRKNIVADGNTPLHIHTIASLFLPAAGGTLILAFSETFWSQALSVEVYSLHLLCLSLLLYLFVRAIAADLSTSTGRGVVGNIWIGFAFVLGLAFGNHMTTILLAPGFLYLYFHANGFSARSFRKLAILSFPFLIGLSVYWYLPVRATAGPMLNWGNPVDLERTLWHISGKVYRVWLFSSTESAGRQLTYFVNTILPEFGYFPVVLAALGIISLMRTSRVLLLFTVLLFTGCVGYAINYDIHDIDSYFLLAYIVVALWSAAGIRWLVERVGAQQGRLAAAVVVLGAALSLAPLRAGNSDLSDHRLVETYADDLFRSVEQNAIVISYQWDYFVSASYYLQHVEGRRPDVVVIDKELLRRSWYFVQLKRQHPWFIERSQAEIDLFLPELYKFEHGLPYNPTVIEYRYTQLIRSFIEKNYALRPIYVTPEIEDQYSAGYGRSPAGLALRLSADSVVHDVPFPDMVIPVPVRKDKYGETVVSLYIEAFLRKAIALQMQGRSEDAKKLTTAVLRAYPGHQRARAVMNILEGGS